MTIERLLTNWSVYQQSWLQGLLLRRTCRFLP